MKVTMNGIFFTQFKMAAYVWPTLHHLAERTVGEWVAPETTSLFDLRVEYILCENTATETFRVTDVTGRHCYIQDFSALPCASSGCRAIHDIMELLNMGWNLGGDPECTKRAKTQTALTQTHAWFVKAMQAMLQQKIVNLGELKAPSHPDFCEQLVKGI